MCTPPLFYDNDDFNLKNMSDFRFDIDAIYPESANPADIFAGLTSELQERFRITKGVLIVREGLGTRYIAVARFLSGKEVRRLSILLPTKSSLFEVAAEDGNIYTENYFGLFSGNSFEKNLLLDKHTESFLLHPIKYEGRVVAVIGYSSDTTDAFVTLDDDLLTIVGEQLGRRIAAANYLPT